MNSQFIYVSAETEYGSYDDSAEAVIKTEVIDDNQKLVNLVWSHVGYTGQRLFIEKIKKSGDLMQDLIDEMPRYCKFKEEETVYISNFGRLTPLVPTSLNEWDIERLVHGDICLVRKVSINNTGDVNLDKRLATAKKRLDAAKKKTEAAKIKNKERTEARKIAKAQKLLEKAGKKVVDG